MTIHVQPTAPDPGELTCQELVELVTDYLERALPPAPAARFARHLATCADCPIHLDQVRTTIRLTGRLVGTDLPPAGRATLLAHFRAWRSASPRDRFRPRTRPL